MITLRIPEKNLKTRPCNEDPHKIYNRYMKRMKVEPQICGAKVL